MSSRFTQAMKVKTATANREDIARYSAVSKAQSILIKVARGKELDAILGPEFKEKGRLPAHLKDSSTDRTAVFGDACSSCFVAMSVSGACC